MYTKIHLFHLSATKHVLSTFSRPLHSSCFWGGTSSNFSCNDDSEEFRHLAFGWFVFILSPRLWLCRSAFCCNTFQEHHSHKASNSLPDCFEIRPQNWHSWAVQAGSGGHDNTSSLWEARFSSHTRRRSRRRLRYCTCDAKISRRANRPLSFQASQIQGLQIIILMFPQAMTMKLSPPSYVNVFIASLFSYVDMSFSNNLWRINNLRIHPHTLTLTTTEYVSMLKRQQPSASQ